jgi:hypothetical protein
MQRDGQSAPAHLAKDSPVDAIRLRHDAIPNLAQA